MTVAIRDAGGATSNKSAGVIGGAAGGVALASSQVARAGGQSIRLTASGGAARGSVALARPLAP
jgi:hypothetical protein